MDLDTATTTKITQLGNSFVTNAMKIAEESETDQIKIAQTILCDITLLADQVSQARPDSKLAVFRTVLGVLDECVQVLEASHNLGLVALAPEVAELSEAFQPEMV